MNNDKLDSKHLKTFRGKKWVPSIMFIFPEYFSEYSGGLERIFLSSNPFF